MPDPTKTKPILRHAEATDVAAEVSPAFFVMNAQQNLTQTVGQGHMCAAKNLPAAVPVVRICGSQRMTNSDSGAAPKDLAICAGSAAAYRVVRCQGCRLVDLMSASMRSGDNSCP